MKLLKKLLIAAPQDHLLLLVSLRDTIGTPYGHHKNILKPLIYNNNSSLGTAGTPLLPPGVLFYCQGSR